MTTDSTDGPAPMKNELKTPVYRMLNGQPSWDEADDSVRLAFNRAMKGRAYGMEALLDAWVWFLAGWQARISAK